jgi:hypothetical protein
VVLMNPFVSTPLDGVDALDRLADRIAGRIAELCRADRPAPAPV